MSLRTIKIFLASSSELKEDRVEFELALQRKNDQLVKEGIYLDLVIWEDFVDTIVTDGLQKEYNRNIKECEIFVLLFFTKVGKYTFEEFTAAHDQYLQEGRPKIYTYFKNAPIESNQLNERDTISLFDFKNKLKEIGHYPTNYKSIGDLKYHFSEQLIKHKVAQPKIQIVEDSMSQRRINKQDWKYLSKIKTKEFRLKLILGFLIFLIGIYANMQKAYNIGSKISTDSEFASVAEKQVNVLITPLDSLNLEIASKSDTVGSLPKNDSVNVMKAVDKTKLTVKKVLTISGRVKEDGTNNPLPNANLKIEIDNSNLKDVITSDRNGDYQFEFNLDFPMDEKDFEKDVKIIASLKNYQTDTFRTFMPNVSFPLRLKKLR